MILQLGDDSCSLLSLRQVRRPRIPENEDDTSGPRGRKDLFNQKHRRSRSATCCLVNEDALNKSQ